MEKIKHVNAELTRNCNLRCDYCFNDSGKVRGAELGLSDWRNAINIAKSYGAESILLTGGEPMTRVDTPEIVSYAVGHGLSTSILSNGYVLNESNRDMIESLDKVQISLDSANSYLHDMVRGSGSWDDAMKAIDYVTSLDVPVEISTVVHYANLCEVDRVAELAHEKGLTVLLRPMQAIGRAQDFGSKGIPAVISEQKEKLIQKFGNVFASDSFGYVPVLGALHDEVMIPKGIVTVQPNGDIRGTNENILRLVA